MTVVSDFPFGAKISVLSEGRVLYGIVFDHKDPPSPGQVGVSLIEQDDLDQHVVWIPISELTHVSDSEWAVLEVMLS